MRKLTLIAGAMLLAAPIFAGDIGLTVGIGSGFMNSSDNTVAATTYNYSLPTNNSFGGNHRLDYGNSASFKVWENGQIWVNYGTAWGDIRLSYMGYKRNAKVTVRGTPNDWATAVAFDMFGHGYDDVDLNSMLKTQQFDLDWTHNMITSDKGSMGWSVGLRHFKTERIIDWQGTAYDGPGLVHSIAIYQHGSEAKGFGLTTGLSGTIKFNDRFSLDSSIKVGYVNGSIDYHANEDGVYYHIFTNRFSDSHKNQSFRTTEMNLHGNVKIWSGLSGYLGYENRRQDGVLGQFDIANYYGTGVQDFKTSDLTYSGIVLGLNWKF